MHFPILSVIFPVNTMVCLGILFPVVMFDLLESFVYPVSTRVFPEEDDESLFTKYWKLDQMS
jgi:hypothetical protein